MDQPAPQPAPQALPPAAPDRAAVQPHAGATIAPVAGVYTAESRELAFELWAWTYGRVFATTAEQTGISLRTLHAWAKAGRWRERFEEERAELAPADQRYVVALGLGADAIAARDFLGAVARGDAPPNKDRQAACVAILDRAGFAPIHFSQLPAKRPPATTGPDPKDMTQEERGRWLLDQLAKQQD